MDNAQSIDKEYHFNLYKRIPLTLVRASGNRVWDSEGREYIDALAGIAVNNVGHCHPKVVEAVRDQVGKLMHVSNFYVTEPQAQLEKRLVGLSPFDRIFFCNSGTEAIEGAIKLSRRYGHLHKKTGSIISMQGCFHGRSLAAIATGKHKYQDGFEPMPEGFTNVPFNDFKALEEKAKAGTIAILIEPIQGEGGVNVADKEFLKKVRLLCDERGILLVFDEIQCGIGRTGTFFAHEQFGVVPDIITLAKGLGGGFPIGAVMAKEEVAGALSYGNHGTTFGGNPLACRSALAAIDALIEEDMMSQARENGAWVMQQLKKMAEEEPAIRQVRGLGLMIGVELDFPGQDVVLDMMNNGVLSNCASGNVIRLVPPLNTPREDLMTILRVLRDAIAHAKKLQS